MCATVTGDDWVSLMEFPASPEVIAADKKDLLKPNDRWCAEIFVPSVLESGAGA